MPKQVEVAYGGLVIVFVTTHCEPDTDVFRWQHHLEELRAVISECTPVEKWHTMQAFESNFTFSPRNACYTTEITPTDLEKMVWEIGTHQWLYGRVSVHAGIHKKTWQCGDGKSIELPDEDSYLHD